MGPYLALKYEIVAEAICAVLTFLVLKLELTLVLLGVYFSENLIHDVWDNSFTHFVHMSNSKCSLI